MKQMRKLLALILVFVMISSLVIGALPALAADVTELYNDSFNTEGLWITEIYPNDVDRSTANNSSARDGCVSVTTFDNTSDHMEFIEVISTHEEDFKFNDVYGLYYNGAEMPVVDINGNSDITVTKGQPIVIWNERVDVAAKGNTIPDAATFRKEMHIPDNALLLKTPYGGGLDPAGTFTIKLRATGEVFCTFTPVSDVDVKDGLSVELQMPLWKDQKTMEIYTKQNIPSAGYVYHDQVLGNIKSIVPDDYAGGVFITELRPDDVSRKDTYGTGSDYFECLEIANTTNKAVTLNKDMSLFLTYKESARKALPVYQYSSSASNHVGASTTCTIPAGGTAVIWCYRYDYLNASSTKFPTLTEFRNAYGISSSVPVYIFVNQNSMNDTYRGFELYTTYSDGTPKLPVSSYFYKGSNTDLGDGTSVLLKARHDGPGMAVYTANATSTIGTVAAAQTKYIKDYGTGFEVELLDGWTIPEYIMEDEPLHVAFKIDYDKRQPRASMTGAHRTMYRFDGEGEFIYCTEGGYRLDGKEDYDVAVRTMLEIVVPAYEVFGHDYIEFYTVSYNDYRATYTGVYRVDIKKVNDVDGIRTNIYDNQHVKGTVAITANDGTTNSKTAIYIDGTKQTTGRMLENGAYLSFYTASGTRHSQFYNALTTTKNEMIANTSDWNYEVPDVQLHHIDSSYFTYSGGKFTTTLRLWAGNQVTYAEDPLLPTANRDDFDVSQVQMRLANGKNYLPTAIGPSSYNGVDTSAKTNLSTSLSTVHKIGDSGKMCPYMDMTFSIPEADSTAVGIKLDTTKLSNGTHTLKVTNGTDTKTVTFIVDNAAPTVTMDLENWEHTPGYVTIAPQISDNYDLKNVSIKLDGQLINVPYETTAFELGTATHTLEVVAEDQAGNVTTKTQKFHADDVSINITDAGAGNVTHNTAKLYLNAQTGSATEATFYEARKIETAAISTFVSDGILPYINYVINVGEVDADDEVVINWDGAASGADDTHAVKLYVRNIRSGAWDQVASVDENGSICNATFSVRDHVENGMANVIVQCTADSALPDTDTTTDGIKNNNANWDGTFVPDDYDFSFAWITDTQYYSEKWPHHYDNILTWIVDKQEEFKIKYVMHTGDICDNYDMPWEWERASQSQEILDNSGIPYGVLAGNHDVAGAQGINTLYWQYFGDHRFENQPTFGGSYKNNLGHYDLISENGQDFIIVYMSWNIYQEEIDWMNQVLAQYADRKAILCLHSYAHVREEMDGILDQFGVLVRDQVVAKNPNVFAVLNGHYEGASYQTVRFDDNKDGKLDRTVYQICTDYQGAWEGGEEYIKFLYFDLDNDQVMINSYSPYFDDFNYYDHELRDLTAEALNASNGVKWETDMDSYKFTVDFDTNKQSILETGFSAYLATNEVLGTANVDETSGTATLTLDGLNYNSNYAWYAELNNVESGYLRTDLYEFTTEDLQEYYLFGWINGGNYACEEDWQNMGQYKFDENGSLTVIFREDSYVAVKELDNRNWYMTQQYVTGTEATLHNTNTGASEKMFIPAQKQITFQLVNNGDGTLSLSYTAQDCAHNYSNEVRVDPTCTQTGSVTATCQICGYVNVEEIPAIGHGYNAFVTAPTCVAAGYTTYICGTCGDDYVADEIPALGHSFENGSCITCGAADPDDLVIPILTLKAPTLEFKDMITVNAMFTAENIDDVVEMGMITYTSQVAEWNVETAAHVIPGTTYDASTGRYIACSQGIHAKYLGDAVYLACYAKLTDGSYIYTKLASYSPVQYATSKLKGNDVPLKQLVVAMLNYGAAAQIHFNHNAQNLANSTLTEEQIALPEAYRADMVSTVASPNTDKQGAFANNKGFSKRYPSISFEGAFCINYFFTPAYVPVGEITLYYWNAADFESAQVMTAENATGSIVMEIQANGEYRADIAGIAAKALSEGVYVAATYTDGVSIWTSGVLGYSIGAYCASQSTKGGTIADLAMATAVYGYQAKQYFG